MQFRSSLATDLALGIDHYGFYGDGVGNNPLGVINTTGINAVTFAAQQPTYQDLIEMETEVALDNALVSNVRYVGNSRFRGHCKSTEMFPGTSGRGRFCSRARCRLGTRHFVGVQALVALLHGEDQ